MAHHPLTLALAETLQAQGLDLSPHHQTAFEKLSAEHPSGIALAQMDTPMMRQFKEAKDAVPDALLFFRMGDFYELFGADAVIAAEVCQLTLTSRDRNSENPVPMAGVPVVNHRVTLKKALAAGFKVAVCDQLEDPKLAKGLVKRDIVRIATPAVPGDLGEDDDSASPAGTWLASAVPTSSGLWALAFVDVSTGVFRYTGKLNQADLEQELITLCPREIIVPQAQADKLTNFARSRFTLIPRVSPMASWIQRSPSDALRLFEDFFELPKLNAFGIPTVEGSLQAVTAILHYLKDAQRGVVKNITSIDYFDVSKHLVLDESTKRHLDFFATSGGERKGSLFYFLNQCATACGARLLAQKLNYPEISRAAAEDSHNSVEALTRNGDSERAFYTELRSTADLDRQLSRAAQNSIDPKGLAWVGQTLFRMPQILALLQNLNEKSDAQKKTAEELTQLLQHAEPLGTLLTRALEDEPAQQVGKGGKIFKAGFNAELDELVDLESNFEEKIAALEAHERGKSGISTLKIGFTRAFGYYFEVSKGKLTQVPAHFERKQTLVNGERYITQELKELEEKALSAAERRTSIERQLLEQLRTEVVAQAGTLTALSRLIAQIDVWRCFAQLAKEHRWCKPAMTDRRVTALESSVHPILSGLRTTQTKFVANDIVFGDTSALSADAFGHGHPDGQVLLVTGPNMAGKSTIMRQAAVAHVLAQMGCYVPAKRATLGMCDKIFTRIGAGDFALRNQSTFMVEMLETAQMLRFATPASLLLIDEIGRGTSTYDGLSLAWAILEDLAERVQARTLFSTHYHELVDAVSARTNVTAMRMEVVEQPTAQGDQIIFTYRFLTGAAGRSYGIHVARLAGIPEGVVKRANIILNGLTSLESGEAARGKLSAKENIPTVVPEPQNRPQPEPATELSAEMKAETAGASAGEDPLHVFLRTIEPDRLSPREALDLIYDICQSARSGSHTMTDQVNSAPARKGARKKQWDASGLPSLF
ncbi:MAG: DNA mismatch repair protein MutS [Proteobacteria bacterium]|nr:DNA mismatch repair protein MutS [Pseudomonadota bacterium]